MNGGSLADRVALVVGGHSGLGLAVARRFASEGAHVVVAGRRGPLVEQVAGELGGTGAVCDVTDDDQVAALVAGVVADRGRLDVAVGSAGFEQATALADLTPARLRAMHAVQLDGALSLMRHACNAMAAGGGGAFCSVSSLTAHNPAAGMTAYASAKAAVEHASRIAAVEYGARQVRVNCVAASLVETPMTARIFGNAIAIRAMTEMTPLGRMGTPDDVAQAVLFLCSDAGGFVTGQTLCVDGGASLLALPTPQVFADVAARLARG
jgi:NAD(P)-dependent dehydrogenase (short-subunit alcohol dehydrogenase family)